MKQILSRKTALILIIIVFSVCTFFAFGSIVMSEDVNLPHIEAEVAQIVGDTAAENSEAANAGYADTETSDKRPREPNMAADLFPVPEPLEMPRYGAERQFDPMDLIDTQFYVFQPTKEINLYAIPKESEVAAKINPRDKITYAEDMKNGYHKIIDILGGVYYVTTYDMQRNLELIGFDGIAAAATEEIPQDAQSYTVAYDGDRVLRFTNSLYLKDNVAGIVEKGSTVYKIGDYGQIFYVVLEDGTAGYMNSQCLETTSPPVPPYDIVSADDSTYAYDEMLKDIELLLERYPKHLQLVETAESTLGYDIPILLMGNPEAEYKILIQASIHAREYPSTAALMKQLEVMLYHIDEPNSSGETYGEMLSRVAYYIIPMSNPDGVLLSQMGEIFIEDEDMRRQVLDIRADNVQDPDSDEYARYFELWKANINGVDLNRNFDANWDMVNDRVGKPAGRNYKGPEVFSEIESQLIKKYVDMDDVKVTVSYHTSGNMIYWWYDQQDEFRYVCIDMAKAIGNKSGYQLMGVGESRYSHGGVKDYGVMEGKPGITYEIGKYVSPIPPISVYYATKRTRVLPELGYWLMLEIDDGAQWLNENMYAKK